MQIEPTILFEVILPLKSMYLIAIIIDKIQNNKVLNKLIINNVFDSIKILIVDNTKPMIIRLIPAKNQFLFIFKLHTPTTMTDKNARFVIIVELSGYNWLMLGPINTNKSRPISI